MTRESSLHEIKFVIVIKAIIIKFEEAYMVLSYNFLISGDLHASERALKLEGLALHFQGHGNRLGQSDVLRFQRL